MRELFAATARYNARVNAIICEYIAGMTEEQYRRRERTYYPSVAGTFLHVIASDSKWLDRLASFRTPELDREAIGTLKAFIGADAEGERMPDRNTLITVRKELDAEIIKLVESIPEEAFARTFTIDFGGKSLELVLWKLLLQWFNHHTHHRGQISALLDLAGIGNDYSLMLDKIE